MSILSKKDWCLQKSVFIPLRVHFAANWGKTLCFLPTVAYLWNWACRLCLTTVKHILPVCLFWCYSKLKPFLIHWDTHRDPDRRRVVAYWSQPQVQCVSNGKKSHLLKKKFKVSFASEKSDPPVISRPCHGRAQRHKSRFLFQEPRCHCGKPSSEHRLRPSWSTKGRCSWLCRSLQGTKWIIKSHVFFTASPA